MIDLERVYMATRSFENGKYGPKFNDDIPDETFTMRELCDHFRTGKREKWSNEQMQAWIDDRYMDDYMPWGYIIPSGERVQSKREKVTLDTYLEKIEFTLQDGKKVKYIRNVLDYPQPGTIFYWSEVTG